MLSSFAPLHHVRRTCATWMDIISTRIPGIFVSASLPFRTLTYVMAYNRVRHHVHYIINRDVRSKNKTRRWLRQRFKRSNLRDRMVCRKALRELCRMFRLPMRTTYEVCHPCCRVRTQKSWSQKTSPSYDGCLRCHRDVRNLVNRETPESIRMFMRRRNIFITWLYGITTG
jgi:hypothetical protein